MLGALARAAADKTEKALSRDLNEWNKLCVIIHSKRVDSYPNICCSICMTAKSDSSLKALSRVLKVLSVSTRVRIVDLLKSRALCVNALASRLDVTPGAVSQHLRIMRDAGLVIDEKRGYFVHYRLDENTLAAWREEMDKLLDPTLGTGANERGSQKCTAISTRVVKCQKT